MSLKRCIGLFEKCCSRMVVYYGLVVLVIFVSMNAEMINLGRVNHLQEYASYPVFYINGQTSFDDKSFRFAKKYYKAIIPAIVNYEKYDLVYKPSTLSRAYAMVGICDYSLGHFDLAINSFQKAIELEPKHFWLYYDAGLTLFRQGQYDKSVAYFEKSFSLTAKDIEESMGLDYVDQWSMDMAQKYEMLNLLIFHEVVNNSFKLVILAYDRLGNTLMSKKLATAAFVSKIDPNNGFFEYYAGIISRKPIINEKDFNMVHNASLNFVPIGQEKFFVEKQQLIARRRR